MFVVLCSRNYVAFVESYEEAKKLAGRYKDGMCKKIVQKEEQAYWINIVKNIPPIKKDAIPVYASGYYHSDQDHDYYAAIAVVFGKFKLTESTLCDGGSHGTALAAIVRALEVTKAIKHITIYTNSLHFLYAIHYGFFNWPGLSTTKEKPHQYLWSRIDKLIGERKEKGNTVLFDHYHSDKNPSIHMAAEKSRHPDNCYIIDSIYPTYHFGNF